MRLWLHTVQYVVLQTTTENCTVPPSYVNYNCIYLYLVSFPVQVDSWSVGAQYIVRSDIWLSGRVACRANPKHWWASPWRIFARVIPRWYEVIGFIKSAPIFHSPTKVSETCLCIPRKIIPAQPQQLWLIHMDNLPLVFWIMRANGWTGIRITQYLDWASPRIDPPGLVEYRSDRE